MPNYNSKSYKKSKNSKNSKSGGRRRKHTMRKYRRGKKVMRGGAEITYRELADKMGPFGSEFEFQFNKNFTNWLDSKNLTMDSKVDMSDKDLNTFGPFNKIKDTL